MPVIITSLIIRVGSLACCAETGWKPVLLNHRLHRDVDVIKILVRFAGFTNRGFAGVAGLGDDPHGRASDGELTELVVSHLERIGWIARSWLIDSSVVRLAHAYPVLEVGFEQRVDFLTGWLGRFRNLQVCGRSGSFRYSWIHDMMQAGRECVETLLSTA